MARQKRLLADKSYYHILTRGNDKRKIFRTQKDYKVFLRIVNSYLEKFEVHIIHYCLMNNHIHFLMYSHKAKDLPKFMQATLQTYGAYFRKNYSAVGFLFQNRYKSHRIYKDAYLLECARYIERNPLRANLVNDLSRYPWSSFMFYATGRDDTTIRKMNLLYSNLGKTPQIRQQCYLNFILKERPYEHIIDQAFKI